MDQTYVIGGVVTVAVAVGVYFVTRTNTKNSMGSNCSKKIGDTDGHYPAGGLDIYFGSQTGTAEGFARILMEEGKAKGFNARTIDMEDFDADTLSNSKLSIFLMATYGEGLYAIFSSSILSPPSILSSLLYSSYNYI